MRIATSPPTLRDALLREAWRATVLGMIFALMLLGCSLAYAGLFGLVGGAWARSAGTLAIAAVAACALAWLSAHRDELIDA